MGDGNNVARSLAILGRDRRRGGGGGVARRSCRWTPWPARVLTTDPAEAVEGAAAVYADVWVSMGDEDADRRRELLAPYRLDDALLARARPDAIALHCLPAHPGEEITAEVLYGERSAVWDQAENRLHVQKALLERLVSETEPQEVPL